MVSETFVSVVDAGVVVVVVDTGDVEVSSISRTTSGVISCCSTVSDENAPTH